MSWLDAGRHFLRTLFARDRVRRELDEEIHFHLDLEAMEQTGVPEGGLHDGHRAARSRFGHVESIREERRRASGLAVFDRLQQDAAYAGRQLWRAPGFTVAVAVTLALGVGANATMFAIIDRIMLRTPSGMSDAERLVQLRSWQVRSSGVRDSSIAHAYPSFMEMRAMTDVFASVTAVRGPIDVPVDRGAVAMNVRGALVGDRYFQTLGVRPALGRFFELEETREPAGSPVAVISHGLWQSRYGGARDVIGRSLFAGGVSYTIIGVAPREFTGHTLSRIDLWLPIASSSGLRWSGADWFDDRGTRFLVVIARLRSDVPVEHARARVAAGWTAWRLRPDRPQRAPTLYFSSLVPARDSQRPEYRVALLLAGVALLLLIVTCANVANLLLARALSRRHEVAIRLALGVSRARLATLFVLDAVLLGLVGGVAALAVARLGVPLVRSVLFAGTQTGDWSIDVRVAAFSLSAALLAGLVAGVIPALQASRPSLLGALRKPHEAAIHRSATRSGLLIAQGALTVVLLAGTGLFVRSLQRIGEQRLGLDLQRIVVADFDDRTTGYTPELVRELYAAMRQRALMLPGVESASLTVGVPFEGQYALPLKLPGRDSIPGMSRGTSPFLYAVTPDFLRTMGTRVIAGRDFTAADDVAGAPSVAVVSAAMARLIWPNGDALGQCFKIELRSETPDCTRVIGIAEDARRESLVGGDERPQYYVPLSQQPPPLSEPTLLVRARDVRAVLSQLAANVQTLRPDLPYVRIRTLQDAVAPELRPWRVGAAVFGLFGGLALLVAALGTYSVMHFSVSQRRHELGVRVALGARRRQLMSLVITHTLWTGGVACAAGVLVVLAGGRFLSRYLFQTSAYDPVVLLVVVLVLLAAALLASLAPAVSATRVSPLVALKAE